jgi:competence protein ComEC
MNLSQRGFSSAYKTQKLSTANFRNIPITGAFKIILIAYLLTFSTFAIGQLNEPYVVRSSVSTCLNVRDDHDDEATSIACLTAGTPVIVVGSFPYWREITFGNNQRGWVAKKYIEPAETPAPDTSTSIPSDAFLTIHFVDVGQGDAIWIQTHDDEIDGNGKFEGYSIVIDGGPYSADNSNPLLPYMEVPAHHGADVEALLITHPHTDHFRGAETISRHFTVNHYYDPGYPSQLSSYKAFLDSMKGTGDSNPRANHIHIGQQNFGVINWGSELQVEVLYSWNGDSQNTLGSGGTEVNNSSIVLRIQYGNHVFLFMGDTEGKKRSDPPSTLKYTEKILLATVPDKLKATVLKIAHHGSETSSTSQFIEAVDPDIVIVQSGRKAFHGTFLPDNSTLQRFCSHNPEVRIYRTDQGDEGLSVQAAVDKDNIIIRSNGSGQPQVQAFQGGIPFPGNFCN